MKPRQAQQYQLMINADFSYQLKNTNGVVCNFSNPATITGREKIYTITREKELLYVGVTRRSMSARLRDGLKPKGKTGYHGYKWKHLNDRLDLHVWVTRDGNNSLDRQNIETIEAEVAFHCRTVCNQWPAYQNEIHFHRSTDNHRELAEKIYAVVTKEAEALSSDKLLRKYFCDV